MAIFKQIADMSVLRKIEWLLMLGMIGAFLHAGTVAADVQNDSYAKAFEIAVAECGLHPCRVPEQYRPAWFNRSCENYEPGQGIINQRRNISDLNVTG